MLDMLVADFAIANKTETELIEPLKVKYLEQISRRIGAFQRLARISEQQFVVHQQGVTHLARIDQIYDTHNR